MDTPPIETSDSTMDLEETKAPIKTTASKTYQYLLQLTETKAQDSIESKDRSDTPMSLPDTGSSSSKSSVPKKIPWSTLVAQSRFRFLAKMEGN